MLYLHLSGAGSLVFASLCSSAMPGEAAAVALMTESRARPDPVAEMAPVSTSTSVPRSNAFPEELQKNVEDLATNQTE